MYNARGDMHVSKYTLNINQNNDFILKFKQLGYNTLTKYYYKYKFLSFQKHYIL